MSEQYELARGECGAGRQRTIAAVHATSDTAHLPEEDRRRGRTSSSCCIGSRAITRQRSPTGAVLTIALRAERMERLYWIMLGPHRQCERNRYGRCEQMSQHVRIRHGVP